MLHDRPSGSSSNYVNFTYHIIGCTDLPNLPSVDSVTDLGVRYCNRLKFSTHVDKILHKAPCLSNLFCTVSMHSRDPVLLSNAFCTFVRPILEYSSAFLESCVQVRNL